MTIFSQHSNSGIPGIGITKVSAIISKEQIVSKHTHSISYYIAINTNHISIIVNIL